MLEGFYTAASGVLMQERAMNVIANNLANVKTPGFKGERVVSTTFEHTLLTCRENGQDRLIGKGAPIRIVDDVPVNFEGDLLEETLRPLDMALIGDGYFNIQSEDQVYLTRNGNFDIDEEGFLVLKGVGQVLGVKGPIQVMRDDFTVERDGTVKDKDGKMLDKLLLTLPQAAPAQTDEAAASPLSKFSNGLYTAADPGLNMPVTAIRVEQEQLERANIDLNREYTQVMETMRAFQSCSAALRTIDDINSKAAVQIAGIG